MDLSPQAGAARRALDSPTRSARLGPLAQPLFLALCLLLVFSVARLAFLVVYRDRLVELPGYPKLLLIGLRFDLMTLAEALFLPVLALLILPVRVVRRCSWCLAAYSAVLVSLALFFELVSVGFLEEYDSRPNRLFLEYLRKSDELTRTILTAYPELLATTLLLVGGAGWLAWRTTRRMLGRLEPWSLGRRMLALPVALTVLFVAERGGVGEREANISTANFSNHHLANELVPNALFRIVCAAVDMRNERPPGEMYGAMPLPEILARVRRWSRIPDSACPEPDASPLHRPPPVPAVARPLNLVLLLQESMGAQFVESLGGRPCTPNLERLSSEGLWFTRMYTTGTRTVRGLEATVCGLPPNPSASVVKLGLAQQDFFTIAALLKTQGYATDYLYGGKAEFDNMESFLLSNGFERSIVQDDFEDPAFVATWGVSDEDLMRRANEEFKAHGDQPFFALVLSTSNHTPFEFPDGRIELYDAEKATRNNSVKYADYAIGELFRLARQEEYFERTVWIIVADHDTRAPSDDLLPLFHFHIPALIIGPGVPRRHFTQIASQIDLMPTALRFLGLNPANPMPGRDLLDLPADDPGRALMQYYRVNGFMSGERLIVHQPDEAPKQFRVEGDRVIGPMPLDLELQRDALAHVLFPWEMYSLQRYRLP